MKICTNIEQSKKLAEFLPKESADMYWSIDEIPFLAFPVNDIVTDWEYAEENGILPAWSLAALLGILPRIEHLKPFIDLSPKLNSEEVAIYYHSEDSPYIVRDNLVDACYELIIKLHELNLI